MDLVIPKSKGIEQRKAALSSVVGGGDYLPYIDFRSGKRAIVQEGNWDADTFAICKSGQETISADKEFDAILLDVRPAAVDYSEGVDKVHNPEGARFLEIKQDTDDGLDGNSYGPEFLLYLPEQKVFATLHLSNKSDRKLGSGKNLDLLGTVVKFGSKSASMKKKDDKGNLKEYTWKVITMETSDLVLQDSDVNKVEMAEVMNTFVKACEESAEVKADETAKADTRSR